MKLKSFKTSIILYFSLLICASLTLLGTISYQTFSSFTEKEMVKNTTSITDQVNQSLDLYLNEIKDSLHFLAIDQNLITMLQDSVSEEAGFESTQDRTRISVLLNNIFSEKSDIRGYFIYNQDYSKQYINSARSIDFQSPFLKQVWQDFKETPYALQTKFYGAHKPDYYDNYDKKADSNNVITIAANIKDAYDPSNPNLYGVAVFDYNINKLNHIFESTQTQLGIESFILDKEKQFVYQTDSDLRLDEVELDQLFHNSAGYWTQMIEGQKMLVVYSTSAVTGWKTVNLLPFTHLDKNLSVIRNTTLLLLAIMIAVTIVLASVITIRASQPILKLVNFMKKVGTGNLNIRVERQTEYEEIMVLNRGVNDMLDKIKELIDDSINRQLLQKEAEYNALQAKMNPHFLYNTLQSISSLSILGRNEDIELVTHSLRELLQYSLYHMNEMVQIKDELHAVENYLHIQNIRYNGRIQYDIQADEHVLSFPVNKFVLQPIIENSIYHGLESKEGAWLISLVIKEEADDIHIMIRDNGIGIKPDKLGSIRQELALMGVRSGRIGLSSIADRLALRFTSKARLTVESEPGNGTTVRLIIPKPQPKEGIQENAIDLAD
ncbi:cache domain-containing sensor histidine kinase [Paenibacillus radicis (ex Gao et al. 2016)]|uniref:cache domain-containing sensor histidine kinase n=1 Tax=Paenibacillus radicis (ex Gao et al. 2016) TaxID=1737354 RepID=UPI00166A2806|nr:sensor histidine kinase [Paenibacillus radicis (ex Gao et al. 2016)]